MLALSNSFNFSQSSTNFYKQAQVKDSLSFGAKGKCLHCGEYGEIESGKAVLNLCHDCHLAIHKAGQAAKRACKLI